MKIVKSCEQIHEEALERCKGLISNGVSSELPKICIIQVGNSPASNAYVRGKLRDLDYCGISYELRIFPESISETDFRIALNYANSQEFTGIIVQMPLPKHLQKIHVEDYISADRDIDGFRKDSLFTPCTPKGIMQFLSENKIPVAGKNVCIVNRSYLVGRPLAKLMLDADASVTVLHSKSSKQDVKFAMGNADIVVVAVGIANFVKPGSVRFDSLVIDVGINRDSDNKMCGDCCLDLRCGYQTPVPKGVGLLTRTAFLENCVESAKYHRRG